jgi:hypothetical protein
LVILLVVVVMLDVFGMVVVVMLVVFGMVVVVMLVVFGMVVVVAIVCIWKRFVAYFKGKFVVIVVTDGFVCVLAVVNPLWLVIVAFQYHNWVVPVALYRFEVEVAGYDRKQWNNAKL